VKELVLIVEDEKDIARMLEYNLKKEDFRTLIARNGEAAIESAGKESPGLVLLDLMLPGIDGLEVCKTLKKEKKTSGIPIIMLTAKSQESDKVIGLELGADDYVTKPFSPRELMARVRAVLRRTDEKRGPSDIFRAGNLVVDFSKIAVAVKGRPVELAAKEFELLKELIKSRGRVLSRDHLLNTIWGFEKSLDIQTRTVDVHIRTLRKKLGSESKRIITVKSYGYRLEEEDEPSP